MVVCLTSSLLISCPSASISWHQMITLFYSWYDADVSINVQHVIAEQSRSCHRCRARVFFATLSLIKTSASDESGTSKMIKASWALEFNQEVILSTIIVVYLIWCRVFEIGIMIKLIFRSMSLASVQAGRDETPSWMGRCKVGWH